MEAPGWHGKLPTLGDFASRRLDADFIEVWDTWLAEGIASLQQADATGWLQAYLDSPSWRFLLMPGVLQGELGRQAWAGVLMPSVDRVGRYFPFTVAQPLPALPVDAQDNRQLSNWIDRLDDIAVDALYDDWTVERLEQALLAEPVPAFGQRAALPPVAPGGPLQVDTVAASHVEGLSELLVGRALGAFAPQAHGTALWLGSAKEDQRRIVTSRGLPQGRHFAALLGAQTTGA